MNDAASISTRAEDNKSLTSPIDKPYVMQNPILLANTSANNTSPNNFTSAIFTQLQEPLSLITSSYTFDLLQKLQQIVSEIGKNMYNNPEDGENIMENNSNNYVTHRELAEKFDRISDKIDSSEKYIDEHIERKAAETNGKIETLIQSINDFKQNLSLNINSAVRNEFDKRDKERKETNRFIIGTLVIGGISLIVSAASLIVSFFIH